MIAVAAVFGVAALAAGVAYGAKSVFGTTHTTVTRIAAPVHRIVVDGNAGDVKLTAGGRVDVEVKQKSSWLFSKPKVRRYVRDGVLHLESHCHHGFLHIGENGGEMRFVVRKFADRALDAVGQRVDRASQLAMLVVGNTCHPAFVPAVGQLFGHGRHFSHRPAERA